MKKGYIFKRRDRWFIALPDPSYASGYRIKAPSYSTRSAAQKALRERKGAVEASQNGWLNEGDTCYTDYIKDYLQFVLTNHSQETFKTYKGVLKDFNIFLKEKHPRIQRLKEFFIRLFEEYKIWLKETNHKDNTVNNHIKVLKTIFNQAIKWELLKKNPVKDVRNVSVEDEKPIVSLDTPEKFELFFERCRRLKPEYRNHYYCTAKLGLRWKEMISLEWEDIDFENAVIAIRKKKGFIPKGRTQKDRKPKTRLIPVAQDVLDVLKSMERGNEKVFLKEGNPISPRDKSFRRWIIAIVRGSQLEGMSRMHELRHTTGRILGLTHSLHEIKEFLGHTDIRTTERYVRVPDAAKKSMAKSLENFGRANNGQRLLRRAGFACAPRNDGEEKKLE